MVGTEPERIIIANRNARVAWVIVLLVFVAAAADGMLAAALRPPKDSPRTLKG
jgi:hypothetical protein